MMPLGRSGGEQWNLCIQKGGYMRKIRLGLYLGDREYGERFIGCLMNHYRDRLELHLFTDSQGLRAACSGMDGLVLSEWGESYEEIGQQIPVIVLYDSEETDKMQEGEVFFVDKYQEVNKIVDEILRHIGEEIKDVQQNGRIGQKLQTFAVYSLAENEYQMPFAVTMASIMSEREKVLLLDLQENSGLSQLVGEGKEAGLEELLVMAESGKYSGARMAGCVEHLDNIDVVCPVCNTECLCEAQAETYRKLLQILAQEMGYTTIIMNMGSRFVGFFEFLADCEGIYLVKSRGGLGQWREKEFRAELEKHTNVDAQKHIRGVELPRVAVPMISCERLVEQWKWNELGDSLRRMIPGVMSVGS